MKILLVGGKEPTPPKVVWDLLAFLHASFAHVKVLIVEDDQSPVNQAGIGWAQSLAIDIVYRSVSKGKPGAVVSICGDKDSDITVAKAREAGIPVYEVHNV